MGPDVSESLDVVKRLNELGCDTEKALERCVHDASLYVKLLRIFAGDTNFAKLGEGIESKNLKLSFGCAHTIKGVAANLGIQPILNIVGPMVETLRDGSFENAAEAYEKLMDAFGQYKTAVAGFDVM